ncbi:hypothetical protein GCM10027047_01310 [Rhodococcus aerolatus]
MTEPHYVFVDALPNSRAGNIPDFAEACRTEAGRWGLYPRAITPDSADHLSRSINDGDNGFFTPKGWFEARVHEGRAWVRFVGGADQ